MVTPAGEHNPCSHSDLYLNLFPGPLSHFSLVFPFPSQGLASELHHDGHLVLRVHTLGSRVCTGCSVLLEPPAMLFKILLWVLFFHPSAEPPFIHSMCF